MLRLKITTRDSSGEYKHIHLRTGTMSLDVTGTLDGVLYPEPTGVELQASRQLSQEDACVQYSDKKLEALSHGGASFDDNLAGTSEQSAQYSFEYGYVEGILRGSLDDTGTAVLQSIQHVTGKDNDIPGAIDILPGKDIDVTPVTEDHSIRITKAITAPDICKLYHDIAILSWRIYHSLNSISGRLQRYAPNMPVDGSRLSEEGYVDPGISTAGRYLGTFLQYQSLVARWNHYAWSSSFYLVAVPAGERLAITIGYTSLDCYRNSVSYTLNVEFSDDEEEDDITYNSKLLTIYNQGTDSSLDTKIANIATTYYRNELEVSGSGYEGRDPAAMESAGLHTEITTEPQQEGLTSHAMLAEQYHRNLVAIAPCIGIDKEYMVQPGTSTKFRKLKITGTWIVGGKQYSKVLNSRIAAVGIYTEEEGQAE